LSIVSARSAGKWRISATQACRIGGVCASATSLRSRKSGGARLPRRVPSPRSGFGEPCQAL
jgi:hypothetical protein